MSCRRRSWCFKCNNYKNQWLAFLLKYFPVYFSSQNDLFLTYTRIIQWWDCEWRLPTLYCLIGYWMAFPFFTLEMCWPLRGAGSTPCCWTGSAPAPGWRAAWLSRDIILPSQQLCPTSQQPSGATAGQLLADSLLRNTSLAGWRGITCSMLPRCCPCWPWRCRMGSMFWISVLHQGENLWLSCSVPVQVREPGAARGGKTKQQLLFHLVPRCSIRILWNLFA